MEQRSEGRAARPAAAIGYDVIGDIHGQAGRLEALLQRMGYTPAGGRWRAPAGRQAVFVGDLIDRGPEQLKVLDIVRRMVDAGDARCVLGNHEFNAIGFVTDSRVEPGQRLRQHSPKNIDQHAEFLRQVGAGSARHDEWVRWFRTLPPCLDLGGIRVVHAWWHQPYVEQAAQGYRDGTLDEDFLHAAYEKGSAAYEAMEGLTKGFELELPAGASFVDAGRVVRHRTRMRWWRDDASDWHAAALLPPGQDGCLQGLALPAAFRPTPVVGAPVFIGHYWLSGQPTVQSGKVACLDYSVAKGGPLVAYRWNGEAELSDAGFVQSP